MAQPGKSFNDGPEIPSSSKRTSPRDAEQNQLDFEFDFFAGVLQRSPDYVDVIRVLASLLSLKGLFRERLKLDKRLVRLRPDDALAHYNLACSYARLKRADLSIKTLRKAVELGYCDFRYMREDHDFDAIKEDPRFRKLLREYETL